MMGKILIIVGVLVAATCSVAIKKELSRDELERSFVKLTDCLSAKLPNNTDPEANLGAVKKCNGGLKMFKRDLKPAAELFLTIANANTCDSSLLKTIELVQGSTQADYPDTRRRADKILRTFIGRALENCDSHYEQTLNETLAEVPPEDRTKVESIMSEKFIQFYQTLDDSDLKLDELTFSPRSIILGFDSYPLAEAVWKEAEFDPSNTIELRDSPKPEDRRKIDKDDVEYLFDKYIIRPCEQYNKVMDAVFKNGKSISKFIDGGDREFLSNRSLAYQHALVRRHLCQQLLDDPESAVRNAVVDFEIRL